MAPAARPDPLASLRALIRAVPDFPRPGIVFRDITPLVRDPAALDEVTGRLIAPFAHARIDAVAGMEARGFIFGTLAAARLGVGFVPLRKPGKLPYDVQRRTYNLEYGSAALEMHVDAVVSGERVLLVDDLLATGGTARASCELVESLGGVVAGLAFVIELDGLNGRARLNGHQVHTLLQFPA